MRISGLQKFSMIDYNDKLSAVIFTQGCNFKCPYCHNPELVPTLSKAPSISSADLFAFLESRVGKLDAVVISGGEPLLQTNLIPFLQDIKQMGFLVKLDTNGFLSETLERVISSGLIDYVAMDIKTSLSEYEKLVKVKVSQDNLWKSIKAIKESGIEHEFRTTLVEGLISEENIYEIGRELIGNSRYYLQNFVKSHHLDESFQSESGFSQAKLTRIVSKLQASGIKVELRS